MLHKCTSNVSNISKDSVIGRVQVGKTASLFAKQIEHDWF